MEKICCLAGHGTLYDEKIQNMIYEHAEQLVVKNGINEFWVGNYGEFDKVAATEIRKLKKKYNIKLYLVIPYITQEINANKTWYEKNYDGIIIPDLRSTTPKRYRIIETNKYMVDHSLYVLCYVKYTGGAEKTLKYAEQKKKAIINLA